MSQKNVLDVSYPTLPLTMLDKIALFDFSVDRSAFVGTVVRSYNP